MSTDSEPLDPSDDLQFETAQISDGQFQDPSIEPQRCAGCGQPITSSYFAIRDKIICPACRAQLNGSPPGSPVVRVIKACVMGLGAGLVGALIWFALRRLAHIEIGLVAVLVGFMVGKAVRKGSGNRGGLGYQVMAVLLTYFCIAANYVPDTVQALLEGSHRNHSEVSSADSTNNSPDAVPDDLSDSGSRSTSPRPSPNSQQKPSPLKAIRALAILVAVVLGISLAAPFLGGAQNIIGLLIIGFALWEAWKFNRPRSLIITGPYQVGAPPAGINA
jgi:hypothetical protein